MTPTEIQAKVAAALAILAEITDTNVGGPEMAMKYLEATEALEDMMGQCEEINGFPGA